MARPSLLSSVFAHGARGRGRCRVALAVVGSSLLAAGFTPAAARAAGAPAVSVVNPAANAIWSDGRIFNVAATDPDGIASARFVLRHLATGKQVLDTTVPVTGNPTQIGGPNNPVGTSWSTTKYPGPDGRYEILMRVTDATGTAGEARREFLFDTTSPTITITSRPVAVKPGVPATITFTATDGPAGSGVQRLDCRLDSGPWDPCPSANHYTVTGLSLGTHQLDVRATDGAGRSTIVSAPTTVDDTAPATTITGGLADFATVNDLELAVWSFSMIEPGYFECRIGRIDDPPGPWSSCRLPTSHRPTDLSPGTYVFQVRAYDLADNHGEPASRTFTYAPAVPQAQPTTALPERSGGPPAPVGAVDFRYAYVLRGRRGKVVVSDLRVTRLTAGATLTATCAGRGCPKTVKLKRRGAKWQLGSLTGRAFPRGTQIVIAATKPGSVGKYVRLTLAAPGKPPKVTERCIAPGSTKPVRCADG